MNYGQVHLKNVKLVEKIKRSLLNKMVSEIPIEIKKHIENITMTEVILILALSAVMSSFYVIMLIKI